MFNNKKNNAELILWATRGNVEKCRFFLTKGADPYYIDDEKKSAITQAIICANLEVIELLFISELNIDELAKNKKGLPHPLHMALTCCLDDRHSETRLGIFKSILKNTRNIDIKDKNGLNLLEVVLNKNRESLVKYSTLEEILIGQGLEASKENNHAG